MSRSARNVFSACSSPAVPAFGRGPRSTARSSDDTAPASNRHIGCLSSASIVTGGSPSSAASAASRANTPAGVSASASPPESSTGTFHRASAASTRRASVRSGVTSAAVLPGVSIASRSATAMASASSSALAASITAMSAIAAIGMRGEVGVAQPIPPQLARRRRPQRLRGQPLTAVRRPLAERRHPVAEDADASEQCRHGELRMPMRGVRGVAAGNDPPGRVVQIGVEAGQHQRAARQPGDGGEQCRGRRDRAGRARRDHRTRAGRETLGLRSNQQVAPFGGLDAAVGEDGRPVRADESQEVERQLPVLVELVRHQPVQLAPSRPAASPCHPSAAPGPWRARRRWPGCWPPAAPDRARAARSFAPISGSAPRAA